MGTDFNPLFDKWAHTYDTFTAGDNKEYREVFTNYENILNSVVDKSSGFIIEFGVGTGNLTKRLVEAGYKVLGIEPSKEMRLIAKQKLPCTRIIKGDFLHFKRPNHVDTIVSTYAFHHLTDEEKWLAIRKYSQMLKQDGKIVFADTMFTDKKAFDMAIREASNQNFHNLVNDLQTEYYTSISVMRSIFEDNGFHVIFSQCNHFVWIAEATKR